LTGICKLLHWIWLLRQEILLEDVDISNMITNKVGQTLPQQRH
jgi:hypothetical protein